MASDRSWVGFSYLGSLGFQATLWSIDGDLVDSVVVCSCSERLDRGSASRFPSDCNGAAIRRLRFCLSTPDTTLDLVRDSEYANQHEIPSLSDIPVWNFNFCGQRRYCSEGYHVALLRPKQCEKNNTLCFSRLASDPSCAALSFAVSAERLNSRPIALPGKPRKRRKATALSGSARAFGRPEAHAAR